MSSVMNSRRFMSAMGLPPSGADTGHDSSKRPTAPSPIGRPPAENAPAAVATTARHATQKACRINSSGRLPKLYVEGSIPFARSKSAFRRAVVA
jgi:hypothetical protein